VRSTYTLTMLWILIGAGGALGAVARHGLNSGFTTFSSFSLDTFTLLREGRHAGAVLNVAGQVGLSLLGVWAGFRISGGT
jgi:fluoride ion exporter CrcB/FEX